jgi:predicted PurR-regulated permease PerM
MRRLGAHRIAREQGSRRGPGGATALFGVVLVTACLYAAWEVAVPLAAALLLAFLLTPAVAALERRHVHPVVAVTLVVVLTVSAFGALATVIGVQVSALATELPRYRGNILAKIADVRGMQKGSPLEPLQRLAQEVIGQFERPGESSPQKPLPVVVTPPSPLWKLPSVLHAAAMAGLVLVLLIFTLLNRAEIRNRLIRLLGYRRLALTTKALDEAGERITAYLVRQAIINTTFALAVALGLFLIGVPYAPLWGFIAGFLRFIPYVGAWLAAFLPAVLCLALYPGWTKPFLALGLVAILDMAMAMSVEPWLYGHGAGVSEVGLLVGLAFWTWLWGPFGLVLGTPMTVCLVVLGKHVPGLAPIAMLLSSESAMPASMAFYQRLIARDVHEAQRVAQTYRREHSREETFDELLVPAIARLSGDQEIGSLDSEDRQFVLEAVETIGRALSDLPAEPVSGDRSAVVADGTGAGPAPAGSLKRAKALGCPAQDDADEVALRLLSLLLDPAQQEMVVLSSRLLASEVLVAVEREQPVAVCFGATSPDGLVQARYLVKRLRERFPDLGVVVGGWGMNQDAPPGRDRLLAVGANHVASTLKAARAHLVHLLHAPLSVNPAGPASGLRAESSRSEVADRRAPR